MKISHAIRNVLTLAVATGLGVGLVFRWPVSAAPAQPVASPVAEDVLSHVGVVDIERLMRANPDFTRLEQIDQEIAYLSAQIESSGPSQDELVKDIRKQLDAMKNRLVEKFQADVARMKSDIDARKAAVESTLKAEAASIGSQLQAYQEELKRKAGAGGAITVGPGADTKVKLQAEMAKASEPLLLVARQKIAARQVEIQQAVDAEMQDAKRKMEGRVAEQMEAVLKADQAQKLQLQLDLQTATDEEQRKSLQDQLARLTDKEETRRDELRKELATDFDARRKAALAKHQADFNAYSAKVKAEVDSQIRARQGAVLSKYGVSGMEPTKVADLQAAMQLKQRELKARFEAHKDELVGGLKAASEQAQAHLKAEQKKIEDKLKAEQKRLIAGAVKSQGKLSAEEKARRDRLSGQLTELKTQRERVHDAIMAQIRENVRKLAEEQKVPLVVGDYRVNIKCQDLTELALKQAAGASSPSASTGTP
ncbi:MAG: hypothetical protein EB084_03985 [Proteobacteria bacterium]|nr:hypothetical protein [Pseudomonadota bacterium]